MKCFVLRVPSNAIHLFAMLRLPVVAERGQDALAEHVVERAVGEQDEEARRRVRVPGRADEQPDRDECREEEEREEKRGTELQAAADPEYFDIRLEMVRIWPERMEGMSASSGASSSTTMSYGPITS